jgi:glycosyltransferase involved in cell wall biosynthesis
MATAGHQLPATSYQPQIVHRPSSTVHRPSFDLIHAHWVIPNGLPALIAARLRGLPLFISLHGSDVYVAEKAAPIAATARGLFRAAQGTTACSGDLYQRALRLGAPHSRIEVVPYGVDTTAFRPDPGASVRVRAELGLPPDAKLVVSVSRMVYKKGLTYLIDAFPAVLSHHPDATLVLGGYGDLREELEQRAIERGIAANVRFPGRLSREQSAAFLGAADIHVVPSVHDQAGNVDGLPNVLLEGMSSGRAIVASDLAGIPDVITDGVHGLLTPERNSAALAKAIIHLFDDPALARQLGEAARRRVLNELTWDAAAERFETMYVRGLEGDGRIAGGL